METLRNNPIDHEEALKKLNAVRLESETKLHETDLEKMRPEDIVSFVAKLALVNGHDLNKVLNDVNRIDKGLGKVLAMQIKDSYNSYGWLVSAVAGVGINAAGLGLAGMNGAFSSNEAAAKTGQAYLQAAQLGSTLTQPSTTWFQNRDEAARSSMQTKQRGIDSNRGEEGQKASQREQKLDQLLQVLERVRQQDSQAKERTTS